MDFIAVLSFSVLVIIVLTLIFGVIAYFLYKIREKQRKSGADIISYEDLREESGREYLFFDEVQGLSK
jgi:heme/copper-type cytochrome/quinol oxidase subunit 2